MKITVTQENIDKGVRGEIGYCPIALAIKALGYEHVCVDDESVDARREEDDPYADAFLSYLPTKATSFIHAFDEGRKVAPFTFEMPDLL